eukprot:13256402-Alexandrium_andersonii.AAC.1
MFRRGQRTLRCSVAIVARAAVVAASQGGPRNAIHRPTRLRVRGGNAEGELRARRGPVPRRLH